MNLKQCTECDSLKEFTEFSKNKLGKFGLKSKCKSCLSSKNKLYYKDNADKKISYALANKEHIANYQANYRKENLKLKLAHNAKRRARAKRAQPNWLTKEDKQQIRKIYETTPPNHHVDHIVPLKGQNVSGLHVPWNLQHLPAEENMRKSNKDVQH